MRVLSVDIGIRHLACCVLESGADGKEKSPGQPLYRIVRWDLFDLCDAEGKKQTCFCCKATGTLTMPPDEHDGDARLLGKRSRPMPPPGALVCRRHAAMAGAFAPDLARKFTHAVIRQAFQAGDAEWRAFCTDQLGMAAFKPPQRGSKAKDSADTRLSSTAPPSTALPSSAPPLPSMREAYDYVRRRVCKPVKGASERRMIDVIYTLATLFRTHAVFAGVDKVVVENQIGPRAVRMKSIQEAISTLAVFSGIAPENITGVSSAHKLGASMMSLTDDHSAPDHSDQPAGGSEYAAHKTEGKRLCEQFLGDPAMFDPVAVGPWKEQYFAASKRDDLADALLQAIYVVRSNA